MENPYKQGNIDDAEIDQHVYETGQVEEEIIYEYAEDPGTIVQDEEEAEVPCYVMGGSYYTQESIDAANQDHSMCYFCKEDLRNKRFYNHLFDHHGFTKQQCEVMKQQKRLESHKGKPSPKMRSLHACTTCEMEFVTKTGLKSHLNKDGSTCGRLLAQSNDSTPTSASNIVCPTYGCAAQFGTYLELAVHVDSFHRDMVTDGKVFMIRRKTFPDKTSFLKWKKDMEIKTSSEFFLRTSQKVIFAVRTTLYKCLCSNSRGQTKTKSEQCPAFIKCCLRNHGQLEVVACFGHIGHEHPTETQKAVEFRLAASRELNYYQTKGRINNHRHRGNQYENDTHHENGMMVLMPEAADDDVFVEEDEGQQKQPSVPRVYTATTSSHHYQEGSY
ncbi:unnamed protein product [Caenorhabditis nigoni]